MNIKPIETQYNGCRFRSRLEARYAVCFDILGLDWQYESEGYEIATGVWYLPDFYIKDFDCFIEIKGEEPSQKELDNARLLSELKPVVIFHGLPSEHPGKVYLFDSTDGSGGEGWWNVWIAAAVFYDGNPAWRLTTFDNRNDRTYLTPYSYKPVKIETAINNLFIPIQDHDLGHEAVVAAKQARFEHGESHE